MLAAGVLAVTSVPASAATTASLCNGTLSVFGNNGADKCTRMATPRKFGRDAVDG